MKCSNCGTEFLEGIFCPECGTKYEPIEDLSIVQSVTVEEKPVVEENYVVEENKNVQDEIVEGVWKNKWISLVLCVFLGCFGVHRFYEGKIISGIIYFLTGGIFLIGWIVDIIRIAIKPNPYRVK